MQRQLAGDPSVPVPTAISSFGRSFFTNRAGSSSFHSLK
jgi:hypothetical protein